MSKRGPLWVTENQSSDYRIPNALQPLREGEERTQRDPLRTGRATEEVGEDQEGHWYIESSSWHPLGYFFFSIKTCSRTPRLLRQPDKWIFKKKKSCRPSQSLDSAQACRSRLERATCHRRIPFPGSTLEAEGSEQRQCLLAAWQAVYTAAHKILAGHLELNPHRTEIGPARGWLLPRAQGRRDGAPRSPVPS